MSNGYRFGQNSGQFLGSEGQAFSNSPARRGRGPSHSDPTFGGGKFSAGQGGVDTYSDCYGLPTYCGWQQVAFAQQVAATTAATIPINPVVAPYFEPKAVYGFGIDANAPGTNLRFTIGAVTVGGSPMLAINTLTPGAVGAVMLSDVFNRSDEPLLVNWSVFSTLGLARELQISVFNLNNTAINIYWVIWGNAVSSMEGYV